MIVHAKPATASRRLAMTLDRAGAFAFAKVSSLFILAPNPSPRIVRQRCYQLPIPSLNVRYEIGTGTLD